MKTPTSQKSDNNKYQLYHIHVEDLQLMYSETKQSCCALRDPCFQNENSSDYTCFKIMNEIMYEMEF